MNCFVYANISKSMNMFCDNISHLIYQKACILFIAEDFCVIRSCTVPPTETAGRVVSTAGKELLCTLFFQLYMLVYIIINGTLYLTSSIICHFMS